jgi:ferredoxin
MKVIIIGSGPAAVGAALALTGRTDIDLTVIDIGLRLEPDRQQVVDVLAAQAPAEWGDEHIDLAATGPAPSRVKGLPVKRSYGSDFPFRDAGQLERIEAREDVNDALISGAYGGFSNVWGSQIMPFTRATLDTWPVAGHEMEAHYEAILTQIPFAAEEDDLAGRFPLLAPSFPLPPASGRTERVLSSYQRHRHRINSAGVTVGKARLAFEASKCVRCGRCMTGCPYGLIYSASHSMDSLRSRGLLRYRSGLLAVQVGEERDGRVWVDARDSATQRIQRFEADRLFLACGAFGTTRLVVSSLQLFAREVTLQESAQITLPFLSRSPVPDPRTEDQFTLNQFNLVLGRDNEDLDQSQLHFYTYNDAFFAAMPAALRWRALQGASTHMLRRLSVALGYLPSWASPRLRLRAEAGRAAHAELPRITVTRDAPRWASNLLLRSVLTRVSRVAPYLDLWPVLPKLMLSAGAKSYHCGSSFPHTAGARTTLSSDVLGRTGPWQRIHMVDASVFPNVPATTFTLTIMANAHRIATDALRDAA